VLRPASKSGVMGETPGRRACRGGTPRGRAAALCALMPDVWRLDGLALLRDVLKDGPLAGRIALVSSFGAQSTVLLDMVASVDPATPVIFLDTLKLFPETDRHREALIALLQLRDVRVVRPEQGGAGAARSARRPVAARSGCMLSGAEDRCPPNGACRLRGVDHRAQTLPGRRAPAAAHDRAEAVVRSDQDQSAGGPGPPRPWSAIAFGATCPSIRLPTRAVARSAASLARVRFQRTSRRAPAGGGAWTSQSVASTRLMRLS
jgi:Phosphoadenosine phosphosulfate reductase family